MSGYESIKKKIKTWMPWRLRYYIKLQEARGNLRIPSGIKQHRPIDEYNEALITAIDKLEIDTMECKAVCEMGPGEYLSHAVMAYQMGMSSGYFVEIDDFIGLDNKADLCSLQIPDTLRNRRELPDCKGGVTWREYLADINTVYGTNSLESYRGIPSESMDYVFSFYVLEHIRKRYFEETIRETYRFMKSGAVGYHVVDFKDHMGGRKNQLRFPENVWEDTDHYKMDMYTNRISLSDMCAIFENVGFRVTRRDVKNFASIPIKRSQLSEGQRRISDKDLLVSEATVVVIK